MKQKMVTMKVRKKNLHVNKNKRRVELRLSGAVVSTFDFKSAGPSSIPDEGRWCTAHPAVHPLKWVMNGLMGEAVV